MINKFDIDFFSDSYYENLTTEISYKGQIICQLNKDKGIDSVEVEFYSNSRILSNEIVIKFPVDDFIEILKQAKTELIDS